MGGTLSCAGRGYRPKDDDAKPYNAPIPKSNGIVAPSEKYIVPSGKFLTVLQQAHNVVTMSFRRRNDAFTTGVYM